MQVSWEAGVTGQQFVPYSSTVIPSPVIINGEELTGDGTILFPLKFQARDVLPPGTATPRHAKCAFGLQQEYVKPATKAPLGLSLWFVSCYDSSGATTISLALLQRVAILNGVIPLDNQTGLAMVASVRAKSWWSIGLNVLKDLGVATVIGQTIAGNAGLSNSPRIANIGLIALDVGTLGASTYTYLAGQQQPSQPLILLSDAMTISATTQSGYGLMLMRAPKGLAGFDVSLP